MQLPQQRKVLRHTKKEKEKKSDDDTSSLLTRDAAKLITPQKNNRLSSSERLRKAGELASARHIRKLFSSGKKGKSVLRRDTLRKFVQCIK
ncbi:hypothetical protein BaRGS_00005999 [Batillaria attramentaria]|uniref:Uncharacterized protein n=1 Tax=Batillaria attramentaria TaxID=370345 RepID=A0ABD0LUQ0_9CAEN